LKPCVASYGGGVNSTAMLIGMWQRGERPDLILFANTGGETPDTMEYVARFSRWLSEHGMPEVHTVVKTTKRAGRFRGANEELTLERYCLEQNVLPSIAYGFKTCSLKFKREPQDEFIKRWHREIVPVGPLERMTKCIGYDAGEPQRAIESPDPDFLNRYPLMEWGWDREECVETIANAGLCVPPKSSCFFCPNMDEMEILRLRDRHPELLERALTLEANAVPAPGSSIKGLSRDLSWRQIIEYDAAQMSFVPRVLPKIPCECWDGE
jgi:hypothetical protein